MDAIFRAAEHGEDLFSASTPSWCHLHGQECEIYDAERGENLFCTGWAGTSCLDVCRPGRRRG